MPNVKNANLNYLNCTWLINPPKARRVYLIFDYINIPSSINKSEKCAENYLSIRSKDRPTRLYKLCGEQRSKKFITNYNDVLINLITDTLTGLSMGFSLVFKAIDQIASGTDIYTSYHSYTRIIGCLLFFVNYL